MAPRTLPGLGLSGFWSLGEDGWNTGADQNWLKMSVVAQLSAISRTTALPGSPGNGDIYIVPAAAVSEPNKVAVRDNGAWVYMTPQEGWRAWVRDTDEQVVFDGSAWGTFGGGGGGISDAPSDGKKYVRKDAAWEEFVGSYDLGVFIGGKPLDAELVCRIQTPRGFSLPINCAGSYGSARVASTGTVAFDLLKNGVSFGTLTFTASGTGVFAAASATTFAAGDVLSITAPATADATLEDISINLKGSAV